MKVGAGAGAEKNSFGSATLVSSELTGVKNGIFRYVYLSVSSDGIYRYVYLSVSSELTAVKMVSIDMYTLVSHRNLLGSKMGSKNRC